MTGERQPSEDDTILSRVWDDISKEYPKATKRLKSWAGSLLTSLHQSTTYELPSDSPGPKYSSYGSETQRLMDHSLIHSQPISGYMLGNRSEAGDQAPAATSLWPSQESPLPQTASQFTEITEKLDTTSPSPITDESRSSSASPCPSLPPTSPRSPEDRHRLDPATPISVPETSSSIDSTLDTKQHHSPGAMHTAPISPSESIHSPTSSESSSDNEKSTHGQNRLGDVHATLGNYPVKDGQCASDAQGASTGDTGSGLDVSDLGGGGGLNLDLGDCVIQ